MSHRARAEALAKERDAQKAAADAMADAHDIVKRERDTLCALLERCEPVLNRKHWIDAAPLQQLIDDVRAALHQPKEQPEP